MKHHLQVVPANADEIVLHMFAYGCIFALIGFIIFLDTTSDYILLYWLSLLMHLKQIRTYSWSIGHRLPLSLALQSECEEFTRDRRMLSTAVVVILREAARRTTGC